MAENLAFAPSSGNYWAYDNDDANVEIYGYLYDWETARDVCPDGRHLPSDEEWKELEMALGMSQAEVKVIGWRGTNEGSKLAGNAGLWTDGALVNDEDLEHQALQPFRAATVTTVVVLTTLVTTGYGGVLLSTVPITPSIGTYTSLTAIYTGATAVRS